jgi:3-oxoacyl-[acyl-carrier protein] reductase
MEIDLRGETALVTGAAKGIGRAIADLFERAGATVVRHTRADADLEDEHAIRAFVARLATPPTILVNNAGIWEDNPIGSAESWTRYRRLMRINCDAAYLLCDLLTPAMKRARRGAIVNISSRAGRRGEPQAAHYAMSKGALHAMTVSLARELAAFGVRVNCVAPGWVATPMTEAHLAEPATREAVEKQTLLGRVATPDEIAGVALWLASPLASYVTGQVVHVNGGSYVNG